MVSATDPETNSESHARTTRFGVPLLLGAFVLVVLTIAVFWILGRRDAAQIVRVSAIQLTRQVADGIEAADIEAYDGAEPLALHALATLVEERMARGEFADAPVEGIVLRIELGAAWRMCGELGRSVAALEAAIRAAMRRDARTRRDGGRDGGRDGWASLADRIVGRTPPDPRCLARVHEELARTWLATGEESQALDAALAALFPANGVADDSRRAVRHVLIAKILRQAGDAPGAAAFAREVVELTPRSRPESAAAGWEARHLLAHDRDESRTFDESIRDRRDALEFAANAFVDDDPRTALSRYDLALRLRDAGARGSEEALREYERSLAVRRARSCGDSRALVEHLGNYGLLLKQSERLRAAEPLVVGAWEMSRRITDGDDRDLATLANNVGTLRHALGDTAGSEVMLRDALAMRRRLFPNGHADVAQTLQNLAWLLQNTDRAAEAVDLAREAVAMLRGLNRADDLDFAIAIDNLGGALADLGHYEEAEQLTREALALERGLIEGDHELVAQTLDNLGVILYRTKRREEAETYFLEALAMRRAVFGARHPDLSLTLRHLAWIEEANGRPQQAQARYREALEAWSDPVDDPDGLARLQVDFAEGVRDGGDPAQAVDLYRKALQTAIASLPRCASELVDAVDGLAISADMSGRHADAEDDLVRAATAAIDTADFPNASRSRIVSALCNLYDFWPEGSGGAEEAPQSLQFWRTRLAEIERD